MPLRDFFRLLLSLLLQTAPSSMILYSLNQICSQVTSSALKSGPVLVLLPFLEGPQTGPVSESFRMQEPWTGTAKNRKKPVRTGCNWSRNEYNKTCAISKTRTYIVRISCRLTFYVNYKPLIIKIS